MALCKDSSGNLVDCDSIKGDFKKSDNLKLGTEMKTVKSLSPAQRKWLKDNPNYKGERKPISEVGKEEKKIYTSSGPSKNTTQNEKLEIIKKGGFIDITTTTPDLTRETTKEISKDPSGIDGFDNKRTYSSKKVDSKTTVNPMSSCSAENPQACVSFDPTKQEQKDIKKEVNKTNRNSLYKTKKDGTQKMKKKLVMPGEYFRNKGFIKGAGLKRNIKRITR